ncbi:MAG TPA: putative Ig domain-containing protein [Nitrospirota bacterium]|nr:putative Ig domain-containing protein [Nitrospirota bacterium]
MRQKILRIFLCAWVVTFFAVACKNDSQDIPRQNIPQTTAETQKADPVQELAATILPGDPDALSNLQAVCNCSGQGSVRYQWEQNGIVLEGEHDATLLHKNRFARGDRITLTVTTAGRSASATVIIRNARPVVTSVTFEPKVIYRGVDITAVPTATDHDGEMVRFNYKWSINGKELAENTATLSGSNLTRGDRISLAVVPYDNNGEGEPFITKPITVPNAPPRFISAPPKEFSGETYSYQAQAEDPDGDPLTYALVSGPSGMNIDPKTGLVTLKITKEHAGTHRIEISAEDPQGSKASQIYSLTLAVP